MPDVKLRFEITDGGTVRVIEDVAEKTKKVGDEAEKSSNRASAAFDKLKIAAAATAAAVGAAATATAVAINRQFQQIDELAKVSRATGVTIRDLSGLQVAADLAGVSLEGVGTSLGIFSRRLIEAQSGVGKSGRIFDALGIDPRSGASTQQYLEQIADRFAVLGTGAEATALSMELFGRSGARMVNLLVQGGQAIRDARAEAEAFGLVVDNTASDAVEQFNDNLSRLGSVSTGIARDLAVALAPTLAEISDDTVDWAKANREVVSSGLAEYLQGLGPIIKTTVDGLLLVNGALDAIADGVIRLMVGSQTNTDITRQVARRYASRGMSRWDLDTPGGMSTAANASFPIDLGAGIEDFARIAASQSVVNERSREYTELLARIRVALGDARAESEGLAASTRAYASGTVWTPFVDGVQAFRDSVDLTLAQAELVPGAINNWTDSIEQAQVAAVNLGDILSDSLVSAVDGLITRGDFNLGDVLESTGKAAMSRMVGAMLKEKLGFDAQFKANFLEYLPGVARQGADAVARNFGAGLQSVASQASNTGQVVQGALAAGGAVYDTGYGMSLSADYGYMTDATTGQAVIVSGGTGLDGQQGSQNAIGGAAAASGWAAAAIAAGVAIGGTANAFSRISQDWYKSEDQLRKEAGNAPFEALGLGGLEWLNRYTPIYQIASWLSNPPNRDQATRGVLADAYWEAGLFPGMFLAKEPPSRFRQYMPGMQGLVGPREIANLSDREKDALGIVSTPRVSPFGGTYRGAETALALAFGLDPTQAQANLGVRAVGLGLSESQYIRELRAVAQAAGGLSGFISETTEQFLNSAVNSSKSRDGNPIAGKLGFDDSSSLKADQARYIEAIRGAITLFEDDLPRGIDAAAIALANFEQVGVASVLNLEAFNQELERQTRIASSLQGGVAGAGASAVQALLTGGDPTAAWRSGLLNSVSSGIASNLVTSLFDNGGAFGAGLTSAILSGDPAQLEQALAGAGEAFGMLTSAAEGFVPIMQTLIDTIEEGAETLGPRSAYADQRTALASRIQQARIAGMSATQQQAYYQRQLGIGGDSLGFLLEDGMISDAERPDFNYAIDQYSNSAFALLGLAGNYASGSRQQRTLQQQAYAALDVAQSALSIAAETATMNDVRVTTMHVASLQISPQAAANLHVG